MELLKIPEGNYQEVYIDPDWLNAEDEKIYYFFYVPDDLETPGKRDRKAVLDYLISLGYNVIVDIVGNINQDIFFFTPCCDKHINNTVEEYIEKKTEKIRNSLEKTNVHEPLSLRFNDEHFPQVIPDLPFMLKNVEENGGIDKVLIETPEQLVKLKEFYEKINDYSFQESIKRTKAKYCLGDDVVFKEDGTSNSCISICRINYKKRFMTDFIMQEFISTPTEYNTSLRVITSSSGDILCASLKYSKIDLDNHQDKYGLIDRYLSNPESPFYLGSHDVVSNSVSGGNSILLGKNSYSDIEKEILEAHGIDTNNATVPKDVVEAALAIAINCRREIGAISGMDFIYDNINKKWFFLEQHEYPMMYTYCEQYNLPYERNMKNLESFMETQRSADIDSRLRALSLAMVKKNEFERAEVQKLIK